MAHFYLKTSCKHYSNDFKEIRCLRYWEVDIQLKNSCSSKDGQYVRWNLLVDLIKM